MLSADDANGQEGQGKVEYHNPAWSPDSKTIAFESNREGKTAVYVIGVDGRGLHRLTDLEFLSSQPNWSPDGRNIVFGSTRSGTGRLYVMNADGSQQTRVANAETGPQFFPSFSPDGQWIAFGVMGPRFSNLYFVYAVRADGSQLRALTDSTQTSWSPAWSKDGHRIEFNQSNIFRPGPGEPLPEFLERRKRSERRMSIRPDGSGIAQIPADSVTGRARNGTIFFVSSREGTPGGYSMNRDGTGVRRIGNASQVEYPSPDGKWTAYTKDDGLYVLEVATAGERLLIGGPATRQLEVWQ